MTDRAESANQVARRLGVSHAKVVGWIKRGELAAVNLANDPAGPPRWRIMPADLEAFLDGRRATPAPKPRPRRRRPRAPQKEYY